MIDDEDINRATLRFEFEAKLFLKAVKIDWALGLALAGSLSPAEL